MLDAAFYESPDFKTLIEEYKRRVVVGRRGTGKSTLLIKLKERAANTKTLAIELAPTDTEVIGLRPFVRHFGDNPSHLRAACKHAWQYAVLNEIGSTLANNYKVKADSALQDLTSLRRMWVRRGDSITTRLFDVLEGMVDTSTEVEKRVATLAQTLSTKSLAQLIGEAVVASSMTVHIIADRLDEGYEPDPIGVAILTGLIYALDELSTALPRTTTTVFIRDNISRAIQLYDDDYSRNIENDVLRLHWDEYHLFNMICLRIRVAFGLRYEQNLKVWNGVTARNLLGKEGFRRCLRLTLYRPRDLLVLLNKAFNNAAAHDRDTIVDEDVNIAADQISCSRLDDLKKEYGEIIPGISTLVSVFNATKPELSVGEITSLIDGIRIQDTHSIAEAQTLEILRAPEDIIHALFSVGFFGVYKPDVPGFIFCHDGRAPDISVTSSSRVLIHPCFWVALNLSDQAITINTSEIHDDYDIQVRSETPEIRRKRLGQIIAELNQIPEGKADAPRFEKWCLQAVRIVFSKGIVDASLHPNKDSNQRRDVVGSNSAATKTWERVLRDYESRQVIFEAKNYSTELGPAEYRQMNSYLSGPYGRLGFIINRSSDESLRRGPELEWVKDMYHNHKKLIIKLPAKLLASWLSKLRNPQKHDAPDNALWKLLDQYENLYLQFGGRALR